MLCALPKLFWWAVKDHTILKAVLQEEHIDQVISDNRFGLYNKEVESVYITHQLHILLPKGWRWLESLAARLHARIYTRYNKVWVPDYAAKEESLAGELSHLQAVSIQYSAISYIGPLSRFGITGYRNTESTKKYDVVAVLSGLEPHRSMLEQEIIARFAEKDERVLIVQGLMHRPNTLIKRGNTTIVPRMKDAELAAALLGAKHIIARSGYSTIMDLAALGLLEAKRQTSGAKIELIPTPGQPEQEYLATWIAQKTLF